MWYGAAEKLKSNFRNFLYFKQTWKANFPLIRFWYSEAKCLLGQVSIYKYVEAAAWAHRQSSVSWSNCLTPLFDAYETLPQVPALEIHTQNTFQSYIGVPLSPDIPIEIFLHAMVLHRGDLDAAANSSFQLAKREKAKISTWSTDF